MPIESTNLITNPSLELGTAGWGTLQAGTVGTTSQYQAFGAWSGSIAPTSNGTAGAVSPTFTSGDGTTYYFSAYVKGANGIPYRLAVGNSSGVSFVGSTTFTGGGTWQRYVGSYTESGGATRRVVLTKNASADTSAFYVDAVQVEPAAYTTYLDGDQDGCTWQGASHQSASIRSGQSRAGGSVVALADLGLVVDSVDGIGMPPLENSSQNYALLDGAEYQRTRAAARPITFEVSMPGASLQGLHTLRRQVINAFKIDAVTPQQPVRFWYTGAGGTVQIDAVLDAGMELTGIGAGAGFLEEAGLRFVAFDPYWRSTTQQGTSLAPRINLGSTNYVAKRSPLGLWGTLGAAGTTFGQNTGAINVYTTMVNDAGTVFFGGQWGTAGGTISPRIAMYYPATNTFGTLTGGTLAAGQVNSIVRSPAGSIYVGGGFLAAGGTTLSHVAQWNGAWGSLSGGTLSSNASHLVVSLLYTSLGSLAIAGTFTSINGTATKNVALWNGVSSGTLTNGTVNGRAYALAEGFDRRLYVGGQYTEAGGTQALGISQWNGTWGTLTGGTLSTASIVQYLAIGPDGRLYVVGDFTGVGSGTYNSVAVWNGVGYAPLVSGVSINNAGTYGDVWVVVSNQADNSLDIGGRFNLAGSIVLNDSFAHWNGYAWQSADINLPGAGSVYTLAYGLDRTLYIGGNFTGTATAASVTQIVNSGMAQAYPVFCFYNNSSGTAKLTKLLNSTTGDAIYFNLTLLAQERATLDLTPGARSFVSLSRGNVFNGILPSSNLATWRLLPGANNITFLADNDSLQTSLYFTPRHWSADGTYIP